jgi:hypothetical protein
MNEAAGAPVTTFSGTPGLQKNDWGDSAWRRGLTIKTTIKTVILDDLNHQE